MSSSLNLRDASAVAEVFDRAADAMLGSPLRDGSVVRLSSGAASSGALLITGDLHDNPVHLQKVLALTRLEASPHHHVVLHEIIHGERLVNNLDFSHRMLARVAELVTQHPLQVHPLLANHELSQMTGRGVSKGAGNSVELFNDGLEFAFGEDWETVSDAMKRFIRAMPLALITSNGICCSHSLPAAHMMKSFDVNIVRRELTAEDYQSPLGSAHLMVWGRGHTAEQLESLAREWSVELFCIGHEHVETGIEAKGPRLLAINSDHERGAAVSIQLDQPPPSIESLVMNAHRLAAM